MQWATILTSPCGLGDFAVGIRLLSGSGRRGPSCGGETMNWRHDAVVRNPFWSALILFLLVAPVLLLFVYFGLADQVFRLLGLSPRGATILLGASLVRKAGGVAVMSIGGAGIFDGIVLTGILAPFLATLS